MSDKMREAAERLAAIVLNQCGGYLSGPGYEAAQAARALREALAQPEQRGEVVGWYKIFRGEPSFVPYRTFVPEDALATGWQEVCTAPPAPVVPVVPNRLMSWAEHHAGDSLTDVQLGYESARRDVAAMLAAAPKVAAKGAES